MQHTPRPIAIGGGGFTHGSDAAMEDFILAQSVGARARIGFIGTALWDVVWSAGQEYNITPGCPNLIERIEGGLSMIEHAYLTPGQIVTVRSSDDCQRPGEISALPIA